MVILSKDYILLRTGEYKIDNEDVSIIQNNQLFFSLSQLYELKEYIEHTISIYKKFPQTLSEKNIEEENIASQRYYQPISDESKAKKNRNDIKSNIYLFCIKPNDVYKIGLSNNIERRVSEVSKFTKKEIEGIHVHHQVENAYEKEMFLHEHFNDKLLMGEWFKLSP